MSLIFKRLHHEVFANCNFSSFTHFGCPLPLSQSQRKPGSAILTCVLLLTAEFPWQASLQWLDEHNCGASLISDTWLITAAHCVYGDLASDFRVVLGAHDLHTQKEGAYRLFTVAKIIIHPDYNGQATKPGDIALIRLTKPADISTKFIRPIQLPEEGELFDRDSHDKAVTCFISGWGSLYGLGTMIPNILQKLRVEVLPRDFCVAPGRGKHHLCVRDVHRTGSACSGDSGGPVACHVDGGWRLAGAASYVFNDCDNIIPNVYTSISFYRKWIRENTGL